MDLSRSFLQTLTWDAQNRLIRVVQLDGSNNGSLWTAVYDGLGRMLASAQQTVSGGSLTGSPTVIASIYDPQTAQEIGVSVNGVKAWKVYGTGGLLEATIVDATRATKGVLSDQFGNGVASVSGSTVTWYATKVGAYGPLPGFASPPLTDVTQLAEASAWHGYYMDGTGFYHFGMRYYDPVSGRWLSCDPLGFAASTSLYEFCANDPLNSFDPSGMCPENNLADWAKASDPNAPAGLSSLTYNGNNSWNVSIVNPDGSVFDPQAMRLYFQADTSTGLRAASATEIAEYALTMDQFGRQFAQDIAQGAANYNELQLNQATKTLDMLDSPEGRLTLTAQFGLGLAADWAMNAVSTTSLPAAKTTTTVQQTTILGENMTQRVIPFAEATNAQTLGFGASPEEWAAMSPAEQWKLNDGMLRARISAGDAFTYIGQDPLRNPALRTQFDLTGSELLRLNNSNISYKVVSPTEVQTLIGRP